MKAFINIAMFSSALAAALVSPASAIGQADTAQPAGAALNRSDQKIVVAMAQANMAEVATGKLAVAKGHSAEVRSYGQRMIDDHTKALAEIAALAQSRGMALPKEPDPKHKAMADKLARLTGPEFDRMYIAQAGVNDHKHVRAMLKKDVVSASDPAVKALAAKLLPTVEQHLDSAVEKHAGGTAK